MQLTYDRVQNIAYLRLRPKTAKVRTVPVSDELNVDLAADGSIYGIELLNANAQLAGNGRKLILATKPPAAPRRYVWGADDCRLPLA